MTTNLDKSSYIMSVDFVSEVIDSEAEYERALALAERLVSNHNLSNEESKFLALIITLIEDYENKHYPMGDVTPHAALLHLMEYSGTSQVDLIGTIGSEDVVAEIVSGKSITKVQAQALGTYFQVYASLFI
jgi:HTH-type transcriptional regulator / antitoxin HigA